MGVTKLSAYTVESGNRDIWDNESSSKNKNNQPAI